MPKLKTRSSAAKRFRKTKTGKIRRQKAFAGHLMKDKSPKRRRNLRKGTFVAPGDAKRIKRMIP